MIVTPEDDCFHYLSFAYAKHLISRHGSDGASPSPEGRDLGRG